MNKISCDICMDLIPLVKDNVASEDSYNAVMTHIHGCDECRELFSQMEIENTIQNKNISKNEKMNDKKIISKIKNQLILVAITLVVIGSFIGVILTESQFMFYNILIMPIIGSLSYFTLRRKSYLVVIAMFIFTYLYHFIKYIMEGLFDKSQIASFITAPAMWASIYSGLCALGVLIAFLLYIAFRKENK